MTKPTDAQHAALAEKTSGMSISNGAAVNDEFLKHRIALYDQIKAKRQAELAAQPRIPIKLTLPDARIMDGVSWETCPIDIAKQLSRSLADRALVARVNGELWDLNRPFEKDSTVEILDFDSDDGKQVFWHSSAHILGEACEGTYHSCHLCYGPPIEEGFYYEMGMKGTVSTTDYPVLEAKAKSIVAEKQVFERLEMTKEE